MIMFTARMIRVVLPLIILGIGWKLFKGKFTYKTLLKIVVLTILVSLISDWLIGFLPPLTDKVTLTALGEQQNNAKSSEVFLSGYRIDEKTFTSGQSLEISEGHWFWSGETYAWRPETDPRHPDGVTRTVMVNIPVGWSRILSFAGSPDCGYVEISASGKEWVIDTYRENNETVSISIGRSETSSLIVNQIRYLLLYAVLLFIWFATVFFIMYAVLYYPEGVKVWLGHHTGKLIYLGISITVFCLMFNYANKFSLWVDEMTQVAFVKGSLLEAIRVCLELNLASPPLALMCSAIWYRIAPYGEQWLLLISILLSVLSVYIVGLIGEKIGNIYCGILAAIMMAFSITVWLNAAYEFRDYPYLLMFSTLSLYLYIRKNEYNRHPGCDIAFSFSLTCLAMVHYFGMLACAIYFLGDLFLWYKKQIKWKDVFLFLFPGICSVAWLLAVVVYQGPSFITRWQFYSIPSLSSIKDLLMFLTGKSELSYLLLWFFVANCIAYYLQNDERYDFDWHVFYQSFLFSEIIISITLVYIYGKYFNQKSSLWAERYFIFLIPVVTISSAMIFNDILTLLENRGQSKKAIVIFVGLIFSINTLIFISSATTQSLASYGTSTTRTSQPYREEADWLYQQSDIFNNSTIIISTRNDFAISGWSEYYITRQGRRDALNIVSEINMDQDAVLEYDKIYIHGSVSTWLKTLLDEEYTVVDNNSSGRFRTYVKSNELSN